MSEFVERRCEERRAADLERQDQIVHLRRALESRERIGVAIGMTMVRYRVDVDTAFAYLSRRSQETNIKLRDVATLVIDEFTPEGRGA